MAESVRHGLDENRFVLSKAIIASRFRRVIHSKGVVAFKGVYSLKLKNALHSSTREFSGNSLCVLTVTTNCRDAVGRPPGSYAITPVLIFDRRRYRVTIVPAEEDHWSLKGSREVECRVRIAFRSGTLAEIAHDHEILLRSFESIRRAHLQLQLHPTMIAGSHDMLCLHPWDRPILRRLVSVLRSCKRWCMRAGAGYLRVFADSNLETQR